MQVEKKLAPGEVRFVPKETPARSGRGKVWDVYDRVLGSRPAVRPGIGKIEQDHKTPEAAQAEADRLNGGTS